ncbi:MAG: nitroreductase [Candidatus Azobacteroides sp.]|nr:nitroreductase [Candidatus Azobacteroides sp.]
MKKLFFLAFVLSSILTSCQQPQAQQQTADVNSQPAKNTTVETILNRRSIRSYKFEQIKPETLDTIITCAINAPSAMNLQPWEVRIVQNPEIIKALGDGFKAFVNKGDPEKIANAKSPFHDAPTLIVVAYKKDNDFGQLDCGWLGQNILLAAESMNIGTCVVGGPVKYLNSPEAKEIVSKLNFPEGYEIIYTIAMGYKNEQPEAKPRDRSKVQIIN